MLKNKKISLKFIFILFFSTYLLLVVIISIFFVLEFRKVNKYNTFKNQLFEFNKLSKQVEFDLYKLLKNNYDVATIQNYSSILEQEMKIADSSFFNKNIVTTKLEKEKISKLNSKLKVYNNLYNEFISNIYYLYEPNTGLYTKIKNFEQYIENVKVFKEVGFDVYFIELKNASNKLLNNEITNYDFEKEYLNLYNRLSNLDLSAKQNNYLVLFQNYFSQYYQFVQDYYIKKIKIGRNENEGYFYKLNDLNRDVTDQIEDLIKVSTSKMNHIKILNLYFFIIFLLFLLLYSFLGYFILNKNIFKPISTIIINLKMISKGNLYNVKFNSFIDEVKEFEKILIDTVKQYKNKISIISELSHHNVDIEMNFTTDDELGSAIQTLQNSLQVREKETSAFRSQEEQQKWKANGIAQIGATMRKYTNDLSLLYDNVLREMIEYTDALQGAIYSYNEKENVLELAVAYHYGKKRKKKSRIEPYEGILGTILVEKHPYYLNPVPDNYIFWEMGMGYSKPTSIFIFPLLFEEKIYGVIEIASLNEFQEYQREFFLKLANEFAITISYTIINVQTKKLLQEFENRTKELKDNEKLFKKNQEHLKSIIKSTEQKYDAKDNELQFKESVLKQKIQELIDTEQELVKKEEIIENIVNECENQKSIYLNENKELRERIEELEKRLSKGK